LKGKKNKAQGILKELDPKKSTQATLDAKIRLQEKVGPQNGAHGQKVGR
jgi:hypothetical protein